MKISVHQPAGPVRATIALSGSKSISNRLLIIRAISGLSFDMQNLSGSEDTCLLQKALEQLRQHADREINVNHAGTDFRFLTALLSITPGDHVLTGSERLKQRPMGELVDVLKKLGADISYEEEEGFPPLRIRGKKIKGGKVAIQGHISSQFISALLLVAPCFENGLALEITTPLVSAPYVEMTIALMKQFGIGVGRHENEIVVQQGSYMYNETSYRVEGDWSSAGYWYSIAALSGNCEISLENLSEQSLQADSCIQKIYEAFGVSTSFSVSQEGAPCLTLYKTTAFTKRDFSYNFIDCPDIAQTLACTCVALGVDAGLQGLQTLKIKETDRIAAIKHELEKFGADVAVSGDSISIKNPGQKIANHNVTIQTYHDHRMAMSFAPLCLACDGVVIDDAAVVNKSYPGFWKDLEQAGFIIKQIL